MGFSRERARTGAASRSSAIVAVLAAAALLLAGCGSSSESTGSTGSTEGDDSPDQLAATAADAEVQPGSEPIEDDGPADGSGNRPAGDSDADGPTGIPSFDAIDAVLADFTRCLNAEGAEVEDLGLEQMMVRLPDLPIDADRAEAFSLFYGRDLSEPVIRAALASCQSILDDPAVAIFLPPE